MKKGICFFMFFILIAGMIQAATTYNANVSPIMANGEFIVGDGIYSDGFAIETAANGDTVAIKARNRDGQPLAIVNNRYDVQAGMSLLNPTRPMLAFDWQFTPGSATDMYVMTLDVDFDPGVGSTDFVTIAMAVLDRDKNLTSGYSWQTNGPDGFFTNPADGTWSDNTTPFVYSQSWQMDYSFWGKTYNPNALGEYELKVTLTNVTDNSTISTTAFAQVVPEPATLALLGLGGLLLRKRK